MIITGGKFRGQKIVTTKTNDVRPTSSKVRQSLFNMIFSLEHNEGAFLDLFSGSGIMGIEAISRGFEECVFIEKNPSTAKLIEQNLKKLGIETKPVIADALRFLERTEKKFDIIFADPPYSKTELFEEVIKKVSQRQLLKENGILIIEKPSALNLDFEEKYTLLKDKSYGSTSILFLQAAIS